MKLEEICVERARLQNLPVAGTGHVWKGRVTHLCGVLGCKADEFFTQAYHHFHGDEWRKSRRIREAYQACMRFAQNSRRNRNREPMVPLEVRAFAAYVLHILSEQSQLQAA